MHMMRKCEGEGGRRGGGDVYIESLNKIKVRAEREEGGGYPSLA